MIDVFGKKPNHENVCKMFKLQVIKQLWIKFRQSESFKDLWEKIRNNLEEEELDKVYASFNKVIEKSKGKIDYDILPPKY